MKTVNTKRAAAWAAALVALAAYTGVMYWLHWQQLCAADGFSSDLPFHLQEALYEPVYTALYLFITPLYALGGKAGVALLVTAFQLAALAAFAWGLRGAAPGLSLPVRLLVSLVVNLAQAVWIPRGGYWYLGTVSGTVYHNTTYIALAPFAMLAMLCFYRAWRGMHGKLDARAWLVYTLFLTASTAFKANFVFAFAPALLLLLIADLVRTRGKKVYIALNKPVGIVCTADPREKANIVDFIGHKERIYPIGRLDKDSEGLILLTSDGDIVNKILRAAGKHEKEYEVEVDKPITGEFLRAMESGVPILDTVTLPCKIRKTGERRFTLILVQGLNRQIRRMCEYLGYRVVRLKRVRIMNVRLGNLKSGHWRNLTARELEELLRAL